MGMSITTADKPAWYCHYNVRNLILIHFHNRLSPVDLMRVALWALVYLLRIALFPGKSARLTSINYFAVGLLHGLLNRRGKWRVPA